MKLLVLILFGCVLGTAMAISRPHYDTAKVQQYFNEFIIKYNKHYDDRSNEKLRRFQIFKDNLKIINRLNSFNQSVHGITKFTDLSQTEFQEQKGCLTPSQTLRGVCSRVTDDDINGVEAPESLDLRDRGYVTAVKDQGQCKSCWAFTSVGILEGVNRIKNGELLTFAPKQLMDCLPSTGHCLQDGNTMTAAFMDLIGTDGVMLEEDYPYAAEDTQCQYNPEKARVKVLTCNYFTLNNEEKLKELLTQRGPIGLGLDSIPLQNYVGGIIDTDVCPPNEANHAVLLVGYGTDDGKNYWLIKNSWGSNWGELGYFRVARGRNVCGMNNSYTSSATVE